jgi:hypothetical protein
MIGCGSYDFGTISNTEAYRDPIRLGPIFDPLGQPTIYSLLLCYYWHLLGRFYLSLGSQFSWRRWKFVCFSFWKCCLNFHLDYSAGTTYAFSTYGPALRDNMGYTQTEVNMIPAVGGAIVFVLQFA